MYTQCPDCEIAFRVTASVLQQAAGNVRCGNCGHAFNALHFLSEDMPVAASAKAADPVRDKLAETSRRLLETLDELSGSEEVVIEDTGIEWRVLDDGDDGDDDNSGPVPDKPAQEERRYDDNTPLPDDFGEERKEVYQPLSPLRRDADRAKVSNEFEDRQGDLALSEPEDWTDLLDEVRDPETDALQVEEELAAIHTQLSAREERLNRDTAPVDLESQFGNQAEAMGLGLGSTEDALTDEVPLLAEADVAARLAASAEDVELVPPVADDEIESNDDADAAVGSVTTGDDNDVAVDDAGDGIDARDDDSSKAADADLNDNDDDDEIDVDEIDYGDSEDDDEEFARDDYSDSREPTGEFEAQIDVAASALRGNDDDNSERAPDEHLAPDDEADNEGGDDADSLHVVPQQSEEETSVDMEIDQELMAAATRDSESDARKVSIRNAEQLFDEHADSVETIIMEGEFVRSAIEDQRIAAESAARSQLDDPLDLADTYATSRDKIRGGRRKSDPPSAGMIVGVVLLALVLVGQFVHSSRESLATFGLFNQTIAPIYAMLGTPVTPRWDISAWQFEATNGSVGENNATLTIVSRLANTAAQPLPYPLVHVSLTNRWEDIMGSRILEPADYLAGDLNPGKPVMPGEKFTAVITIDDPSVDATGFKLNVCYRDAPGTVRCAIQDFRN